MSLFSRLFGRKRWERLAEEADDLFEEGIEPAGPQAWASVPTSRADYVSEVVLDVVDPNDTTVPIELRGCRVVQRTYPDGSTRIFYVGDSGFCADEEAVDVLVQAYRDQMVGRAAAGPGTWGAAPASEAAELRQIAAEPQAEVPAPTPVQSAAALAEVPQAPAETTPVGGTAGLSVLAELPGDESVPPEFREALLVRRDGVEFYLTMDGREIPAEEGDRRLAQWERERALAAVRADREQAAGPSPEITPQVLPAPTARPQERPVAPVRRPGFWGEQTREPNPWEQALASAGLTEPEQQPSAAEAVAEQGAVAEPGVDRGPAFRRVVKVAERLRNAVLQGEWTPPALDSETLRSICVEAILGALQDDRMERAARESVAVLEHLSGQGGTGLDRTLRKDLEAGAKVLLVAHPARLPEMDIAVLSAVVRLRFAEAKRNAVVRDLQGLYETVVVRDVANYLMTRNFLEEFTARLEQDERAVSGKVVKLSAIRRLLTDLLSRRASLAVSEVLEHVGRRHMVDLSFMEAGLLTALEPVFRAVTDAFVQELKAAGRKR